MCLSRVLKVLKGDDKTVYTGYKWMYKTPYGEYIGACRANKHPVREWCSSTGPFNKIRGYELGFHIFPSKEDANKHWLAVDEIYTLVKVEYKGVLAKGIEFSELDSNVVVAKYMKIVGAA